MEMRSTRLKLQLGHGICVTHQLLEPRPIARRLLEKRVCARSSSACEHAHSEHHEQSGLNNREETHMAMRMLHKERTSTISTN